MSEKVGIINNELRLSKYHSLGEGDAVEDMTDPVVAVNQVLNQLGTGFLP